MNTSTKLALGIISVFAILAIIFVCTVYGRNDYCPAWNVSIDNDITLSFVSVLGVIITPAVTMITAVLYYSSLLEQRKQNFDNKWQNMLETQLKIRETQEVPFEWLNKNWENTKITIKGYRCMVMAYILYRDLVEVIQTKCDYTCRDTLIREFNEAEQILLDIDEEYRIEQEYLMRYNPKEYKKQLDKADDNRRKAIIGNLFNITGEENGDAHLLAFEFVYKKYFSKTSTYFTHFVSLLRFIERQKEYYSLVDIEDCIKNLCDNLSYCEIELILQYAEYIPKNKELITKYIQL